MAVVVADLRNDFSCLLIDGIRLEAERQEYLLVVAVAGSGQDAQGQVITDLIDRSIDGLVLITPLGTDAELDEAAKTVPLVVLGRHGADARFDSVAVADFAAAGGVVDLLVELGHRNIAYIDRLRAERMTTACPKMSACADTLMRCSAMDSAKGLTLFNRI